MVNQGRLTHCSTSVITISIQDLIVAHHRVHSGAPVRTELLSFRSLHFLSLSEQATIATVCALIGGINASFFVALDHDSIQATIVRA